MCGIAGILRFDGGPARKADLERMIDAIGHRGPDGRGVHLDGPCGLGHARLAIIDPAGGAQPLANEDDTVWIAYNGEAYNYVELAPALERRGHRFRTRSDTETIVHLYEEAAERCVDALNGIFAFAIWDARARRLMLARDRFGVKPLYYVETLDALYFASEVKALLAVGATRAEPDMAAADHYFRFGYVPGRRTMFRGVRKLLPGHVLAATPAGRVEERRYWRLAYAPESAARAPSRFAEAADELRARLEEAVRIQLRSDVPLGIFLSGGIDSSAVVALAARLVGRPLETFSVYYDDGPGFDERPFAAEVAARFGTRHRELRVSPDDFREAIPAFVRHMDEPVTEAAAISLFLLARETKKAVTVVLSGEGSDESFGGYPIYGLMLALERWRRVPGRRALGRLAARLAPAKIARYLALAERPLERRYTGVHLYDDVIRDRVLAPGAAEAPPGERPEDLVLAHYARTARLPALHRMLALDVETWLPDDILVKADKMTMAHGLELRVPFLDHTLCEWAAALPPRWKVRGFAAKRILKRALAGVLPERIVARPKLGFPTPLERLFRGPLLPYVRETLLDASCTSRGLFRREGLEALIAEHEAGRADRHKALWQLLVFEEWMRAFVDASTRRDAVAAA
jgi:asparagine synthase (glutamine-hydrolysing)